MLTSRKLSTGTLGLAVKMRVMPAGKDMVRSPVIFTRHLKGEQGKWSRDMAPLRLDSISGMLRGEEEVDEEEEEGH